MQRIRFFLAVPAVLFFAGCASSVIAKSPAEAAASAMPPAEARADTMERSSRRLDSTAAVVGTVPVAAASLPLPAGSTSIEAVPPPSGETIPNDDRQRVRRRLPGHLLTWTNWGDVSNIANFRIQRHHTRGDECRILAPEDRIVHWGTRASCDLRLAEIVAANQLEPYRGEVIVIVHGLGNNANTMRSITKYLNENSLPTIAITYPSTEARLEECAGYLGEVLESMDQVERFHLVGFSMGGLVIRSWLKHHDAPRLSRIVFIGSPHYGAELADRFLISQAFSNLLGPGAVQLRSDSDAGSGVLPVPDQEFAVIAGAAGTTMGMNPLIPGDDDGMVSLASAKLVGATDHLVVKNMHALLPFDKRVQAAAKRFIETGCLRSKGAIQPIMEREPSDPTESPTTDDAANPVPSFEAARP